MDLLEASSFFDNDAVHDGYTGSLLFMAHSMPHDDHTSSGATVRRRTLVTSPDAAPPARRVVLLNDEFWLVGNNNTDSFQGEVVRRSYGLKKSSGLAKLLTPAQACLNASGTAMHIQREYFRDVTDSQTSSQWDTMWNVFCPFTEPVTKGTFIRLGTSLMRVRNVYPTVDEFLVAESDELDADAAQMVEFIKKGKVNLVTGVQETDSTFVQALQMDLPKSYSYEVEADADAKPGDRAVIVPKAYITPKVGAVMRMLGVEWRVNSTISDRDSWLLHVRRA